MCSLHDVWLSVVRLSVLSMMPVRDRALCRTLNLKSYDFCMQFTLFVKGGKENKNYLPRFYKHFGRMHTSNAI